MVEFNFTVTNARSMLNKVDSIVDSFEELELSIMTITETWLCGGPQQENITDRLLNDHGIGLIHWNRKGRGGGVAVLYKKALGLKEHRFKRKSHEIVAAKGTIQRCSRPIYIFCVYVKPTMSRLRKTEMLELIIEAVNNIKTKEQNPLICITGDFNQLPTSMIEDALPAIKKLDSPATRGDASLDIILCNFAENVKQTSIAPSLESETGCKSDHRVLYATASFEEKHSFN